ncbi:hypothetical protein CDAR_110711 [Caerostris darwini]|uniref:Uncharacterized protein n=1 Tax=Caerostris darwini TaxID=1538125 RepID=A0AAV4SBG5_9ARAC|nr:hypothetical protein CDAR_110711 [Caerostris darwini]
MRNQFVMSKGMWVIVTKTSFGESRTKAGEGVPVASDPERSRPDIDPPSQGRTSIWTHPVKTRLGVSFLESNRAVGGRRKWKRRFFFRRRMLFAKGQSIFSFVHVLFTKALFPLLTKY